MVLERKVRTSSHNMHIPSHAKVPVHKSASCRFFFSISTASWRSKRVDDHSRFYANLRDFGPEVGKSARVRYWSSLRDWCRSRTKRKKRKCAHHSVCIRHTNRSRAHSAQSKRSRRVPNRRQCQAIRGSWVGDGPLRSTAATTGLAASSDKTSRCTA